ncbi:hypothetical protein WJX73_003610 [Symbiochloris irregularis]|uniref:Cilia- and flagella-associated protein 157 n=1 Tax=Symbiochloris irregularis TaxID=706552 RepID=A0AAW1PIV6_9CHLO
MPPKKTAAKGKDGKGKKKEAGGGEAPKNVENLVNEIADKDLRIQDLLLDLAREKQQLAYYDAECSKLSETNRGCQDDLHNINEYLTKQLELSKLKSASLQNTVEQLEAKLELEASAHKAALKQVYAEWAQDRSNVTAELVAMESDVEAGKTASAERVDMIAALEAAQEHTAKARHECQLQIEEFERQAAGFKERVRLHAEQSMRECEERVRGEALGKANQTFVEMSQALKKSHAELEQLAGRTQELMQNQVILQRDLDLYKGRETAHTRKTAMLKRAVMVLTARVKDAESERSDHAAGVADLREALAEAEGAASGAGDLAAESAREVASLKREIESLRATHKAALRRKPSFVARPESTSLDAVFQCINNVLFARTRAALLAQTGADQDASAADDLPAAEDSAASAGTADSAPAAVPGGDSVYSPLSAEECQALGQSLMQAAGGGTGMGSGLILTLPHQFSISAHGHTASTSPPRSPSTAAFTHSLKLNLHDLTDKRPTSALASSQYSSEGARLSRAAEAADSSPASSHPEKLQNPAADVANALGQYLDAQAGAEASAQDMSEAKEGGADVSGAALEATGEPEHLEAKEHARMMRRLFSKAGRVSFALRDAEEVNKMIAHLAV